MALAPDVEKFVASGGRGDPDAVGQRLAQMRAVVAEQLPSIDVPWPAVIAALAARSDAQGLSVVSDEGVVEIAVACACVQGDARALVVFETRYASVIPSALAHMKLDPATTQDIAQTVRQKLVVPDADGEIKLVRYAGGGSLRGLVKVTAVRTALSHLRATKGAPAPTDDFERIAAQVDNPELTFLKAHYRQAFAEAFELAVGTLQDRERNVLRMHLLGAMTLQEIASMYAVDRSTIVRTLQRARGRLLSETRKQLRGRLGVGRSELDSVVALIRSRLDVSLGRLLQSVAAPTTTDDTNR